ncbi:MAG: cytochrome c3 family protein [Desulfobacterales bacterium]|nr:cytochrome c3 family protein [Desulfobacterales bacterium]
MKRFFVAVSCLVVIFTMSDVFAQDGPDTLELPTGTITLMAPEGSEREPTLSPVLFPHSLHFSYSCKDCHHAWDGESPVQSCAAAGCHENLWAPKPGSTPKGEKRIKSLTGAYHQTCRDCHREEIVVQKAAGIKDVSTGPIECEGCHPTPHSEPENSEESLSVPLGNIIIEPPEDVEAKKESVDFPHGAHFGFACQDCHHDWDGESEVTGCSTEGCHDETEPSGTRDIKDPDNVLYYLAAYHNACVGCHRETTQQRNKAIKEAELKKAHVDEKDLPAAGPVGCNDCHTGS